MSIKCRFLLILVIYLYRTTTTCQAADPSTEQPPVEPAVAVASVQNSFKIEPLAARVFATIAKTGSKATTNALFVIGKDYIIAAGAHMSKPLIDELYKAITACTITPVTPTSTSTSPHAKIS
jgi:hypothetical protein